MEPIDYLKAFYAQPQTQQTLAGNVEGVLATHRLAARAIPFYSHSPPDDWLHGALAGWGCVAERIGKGVARYKGVASFTDKDGQRQRQPAFFFVYDHPEFSNVHALVTLEASPVFKRLRRAMEAAFPTAVTTFITHRTLHRLVERFQRENGLSRLVIKRASCRLRLPARAKEGARRVMPMVSWPDMDLHEAFDWVYQHNGWFQSIEFDAWRDHRVLATVSFSRQGITRATGLFSKVFSGFVDPVCKILDENVRFFGQRSRRERADLSVRPLVIDFESEQIAEDDDRRMFVDAMRGYRAASVSVLHGNPYVHLTVLDYYDGSVFEVWVLSASEVFVVPQMKGTVAATKRLISHIFDEYAEGTLRDYTEARP